MIFSTNLISQADLIRGTRTLLQSVIPTANVDRATILANINLALADLDYSDPLIVQRTIDVRMLSGQGSPTVKVTTQHYGSQVIACYLGDTTEANQVAFTMLDACRAQVHAVIDQDQLHALIRWPRQPEPIPYSDLPLGYPSFADVR